MRYFLKTKNWNRLSNSSCDQIYLTYSTDVTSYENRQALYQHFLTYFIPFFMILLSYSSSSIAQEPAPILTVSEKSISGNTAYPTSEKADPWKFLHNYHAKYSVFYDGSKVGNATRALTKKDNQWTLMTQAKLSKLFFKVKSKEFAEFQIKAQQLVTKRFFSETKRTFKEDKKMEQVFDWENKTENGLNGKKQWQLELKQQVFDRVSHVIQLRSDLLNNKNNFSYNISYKGKRENYTYLLEKKESIKTDMGELSSLKLVRTKSNGDIFVFWLSPELNYLPIKIAQFEKDKADVVMLLDSYIPVLLEDA